MRWPTSATRAPPSSTPRATRGRSSCGARIATATLSSGCPRAPQRSPKLARKKYLRLHAVEVERAIDERAAVLAEMAEAEVERELALQVAKLKAEEEQREKVALLEEKVIPTFARARKRSVSLDALDDGMCTHPVQVCVHVCMRMRRKCTCAAHMHAPHSRMHL